MNDFNLIYFGSPYYSCNVLRSLLDSKFNVTSVISQKSIHQRRNKKKETAVTEFASKRNLRVLTPENLNDTNFVKELENQHPDFFVLFSYGKILKNNLLKIPKYGCINIHCSLLPKWRGGAPVQRALLNGDKITGVTFFTIDESLDKGNIIDMFECPIELDDNAITLQNKLASVAADNIGDIIRTYSIAKFSKQNDQEATYAKKILKEEGHINWGASSESIVRQIRAFVEWPKAHATIFGFDLKILDATVSSIKSNVGHGEVVKFSKDGLCIKTGDGSVNITKIQLPAKNPIHIRDFFNSNFKLSKNLKDNRQK